MTNARKAGWVKEPGPELECCPECYAAVADYHEGLTVIDKRRVN